MLTNYDDKWVFELGDGDFLGDAIGSVVHTLDRLEEQNATIRRRAQEMLEERAAGRSWSDILRNGDAGPRVLELLTAKQDFYGEMNGQLRRAKAAALRDEGCSHSEIAALLGVTRQRIAQLLRDVDRS